MDAGEGFYLHIIIVDRAMPIVEKSRRAVRRDVEVITQDDAERRQRGSRSSR